jgi:Glycosyl transferase family 2
MGEGLFINIVIPVHNPGPFLRETLDSVAAQHYRNFQCTIIDDCSTDGSAELLWDTRLEHSLIRYIRPAERLGSPARSRNFALDVLASERTDETVVAFLDHDDRWEPSHLGAIVDALETRPDVALVAANARLITSDGTVFLRRYWSTPLEGTPREAVILGPIAPTLSCVAIRYDSGMLKDLRFDENMKVADDWEICYRILIGMDRQAWLIDNPTADWRQHEGNTSGSLAAIETGFQEQISVLERDIEANVLCGPLETLARRRIGQLSTIWANAIVRHGQGRRALEVYGHAVQSGGLRSRERFQVALMRSLVSTAPRLACRALRSRHGRVPPPQRGGSAELPP